MAGFGEFLGKTGEAAWQLFVWQIAGQIVSAALTPYLTELTYLVNEKHPDIVLPVNDLVAGVIRGHITQADAAGDAAKLGIDGERFTHLLEIARVKIAAPDLAQLVVRGFMDRQTATTEAGFTGWDTHRFDLLTKIAADAPGPGDLAIALRRELITEDSPDPDVPSFAGGIRQGRLSNIWIPMFHGLAEDWPTWQEALNADLQGQLSHDDAMAMYKRLGGRPEFYQWLFNTRGQAPTPTQALELLNRGIITERGRGPEQTSYEQAFLEGPWRNKWLEPFLALRTYVLPPRSVVAMVHNGALTDQQAATELAKSGVAPEQAAALIIEGHHRAAATDKDLAKADILAMYSDRLIPQADAHSLLTALGYSDDNATLLTELTDLRRSIAAVNTAVSRIHTLYVSHKITRAAAIEVLKKLGIPQDQLSEIVHTWDLEAAANIKQLTEAQIARAYKLEFITQAEATDELVTLGYTPFDAWILLSNATGGAQPDKPPRTPSPVGTIP